MFSAMNNKNVYRQLPMACSSAMEPGNYQEGKILDLSMFREEFSQVEFQLKKPTGSSHAYRPTRHDEGPRRRTLTQDHNAGP